LFELDLLEIALNDWFHIVVDIDLSEDVFSKIIEEGSLHLLDVLDLGVLYKVGEAYVGDFLDLHSLGGVVAVELSLQRVERVHDGVLKLVVRGPISQNV
jgi:hypothetical protein